MKIKNITIPLFIILNLIQFPILAQCTGGTLVWNDEFSSSSIDFTKWAYQTGDGCAVGLCGWGNGELEYYTTNTNNIGVTGGNLVIKVIKEPTAGSGATFTSGKILSKGLFFKTYGRFEASIRMPEGKGLWPAFWMLPEVNAWPTTGEIDISEYRGDSVLKTSGTLHYGNTWPGNLWDGSDCYHTASLAAAFHLYAVEWNTNEIRWYFDNRLFKIEARTPINSLNPASNNAVVWPWTSNFHILLNMAVGGWFTGTTDPNAIVLTKPTMEIDYVRVYDMTPVVNIQQTPYNGTPSPIPGKIEAEEFDRGCDQAAYYDTDLPNNGLVFRGERVDIQPCVDAGPGYNVGWTANGEWMEYTVNVAATGTYNLDFRVASTSNVGRLHVEMDGTDITGQVSIPNTGAWTNWATVSAINKSMTAGVHIMKVVIDVAGFNFNYLNVITNSVAPVTLIDFSAAQHDSYNLISWTTTKEINNDYFTLERSYNLVEWETTAIITPEGSGEKVQEYAQKDYTALGTLVYYRLKQTDNDGTNTYSQVVAIHLDSAVQIYPNPFSETVSISLPTGTTHAILTDAAGALLSTPTLSNETSVIEIGASWAKGIYLLRLPNGKVFKIVKH